jgi:hypothetical protein
LDASEEDVLASARVIENTILPLNHSLFGQDPEPGIDGDPSLHILHSSKVGRNIIGYFAASDLFVQAVNEFSNEREMLYINLDNAPFNSDIYYGVIAHELQHISLWQMDSNEASWVSEGLSELAAYLSGYNEIDYESAFASQPDTQLTSWGFQDESQANYGAAFLFSAYFYQRFGEESLHRLVRSPEDSAAGFEAALADIPSVTFDSLFAQWSVANYLHSHGQGTSVYAYQDIEIPEMEAEASIRRFPTEGGGSVSPYGTDYIEIQADSMLTVDFAGTRQVGLIPADPHSGDYFWTTYPADESDQTLTRAFDLSNTEEATLRFWSWYEIESGWDYAYVTVSSDGGSTWTPLETIYTTLADPQGHSYGPGFTGNSGGRDEPEWVEQQADLSPYAGQEVLVRFQYITDQAVHTAGFAVDDIAIPEIGYSDDAEAGDGGWQAAGFARHGNVLPQQFLIQFILLGEGEEPVVERVWLDEAQRAGFWLPLGINYQEAVLVISSVTPVTTLPGSYTYTIYE